MILSEVYEREKIFASYRATKVVKKNGFSNDFILSITGPSEIKIENL